MSEEGRGGRSYEAQSLFVKFFYKSLILLAVGAIVFYFIPGLFVHIMVVFVLISILSGSWIKKHPFWQLIFMLALVTFILIIIAVTFLSDVGLVSERQYSGFMGRISESRARVGEVNLNVFDMWRDFQDRQVAIATGDHFTGQVEQSKEDQDLGLQLERLESSGMNLIEGEEAIFWVTLKGKSLGEEIINGNIGCYGEVGDEKIESTTPQSNFEIYSYEMNQYECMFPNLPGEQSFKVTFWTEYDFKTLAYKKDYFIDRERLRTFNMLNQDPLREAGITDTNPRAIYTQGPIQIGIGSSDYQPIPVGENDDRLFVLGITLETRSFWKGKINRINDLEIQIHRSMELDTDRCDHIFLRSTDQGCRDRCNGVEECINQCGNYLFYKLADVEKERIEEIENYITFKCPVMVFTKNDLLGDSPISTRFVRVIADYNFMSELERNFFVRKIDEED